MFERGVPFMSYVQQRRNSMGKHSDFYVKEQLAP